MVRKKKAKETKQSLYKKTHPWVRYVEYARRRCNDLGSHWFKFYRAKGITCSLNAAETKLLWERDKAHLLKRASLDRIRPKEGYHFDNCRFIEFNLNVRMAWDPTAAPEPEYPEPPSEALTFPPEWEVA